MMKKFCLLISSLFIFIDTHAASGFQEDQMTLYTNALQEQVTIAEKKAGSLLQRMQSNPRVSGDFEHATKMIEVKKSLVKHFSNSPALESPSVRWMLLDILKKDSITEQDLTSLQKNANQALGRE